MAKAPTNWHAEDVKARVRKDHGTLEALAGKRGVTGAVLRSCLRRPIPRGNRIIAAALGKEVHEIWPDWYDADGNRHSTSRSDGDSRRQICASHRQKAAAA